MDPSSEEFVMLGEESLQVQFRVGSSARCSHTQTEQEDLFSSSMPLQVSSTYAQAAASPGRQLIRGVAGWNEFSSFPPKPQDKEERSSRKESQRGTRGGLFSMFSSRGDNGISVARHRKVEEDVQELHLKIKRSAEECIAQQGQVEKLQQHVEELKTEGKRCRAALEKHRAMLEASEAHRQQLENSHASKEAVWRGEMGVLNERCAEASFSKDTLENDLVALKEEHNQLRASLPGVDSRAGLQPTHSAATPVLSFETGFGSIEQRAILESISLRAEGLARMLLEGGLVDATQVYSAYFTAGMRSFVDLNNKQYPPAFRAALQHYLVDSMLKFAFKLQWPDIVALDWACLYSSEPGVAAAGEQLRAEMFRAWYLLACKSQGEQRGMISCTHAGDALDQQVSQLAESVLPNIQHPAIQTCLQDLAFDFVKLRLLVGSLQPICPGIKAIFKREPGPYDPELCDVPLLNLLAEQHMADARSRFILFCLRPGLAYPDQHGKRVVLVKQQVVTLVGTD